MLANIFQALTLIQADFLKESQVSRRQTLCHTLPNTNHMCQKLSLTAPVCRCSVKTHLSVKCRSLWKRRNKVSFQFIVSLLFPPPISVIARPCDVCLLCSFLNLFFTDSKNWVSEKQVEFLEPGPSPSPYKYSPAVLSDLQVTCGTSLCLLIVPCDVFMAPWEGNFLSIGCLLIRVGRIFLAHISRWPTQQEAIEFVNY